jgi:hypothetical protein
MKVNIKHLDDKLASNKIRRYVYVLRLNEDTIAKKIFNMKQKKKKMPERLTEVKRK